VAALSDVGERAQDDDITGDAQREVVPNSIRPGDDAVVTRCWRQPGRGSTRRVARGSRKACARRAPKIAVFPAFVDTVTDGGDQSVAIDTAPTGHALLLLDAGEAYHREVVREPWGRSEEVQRLLPRLRDPLIARVLLVTLPEATLIHEAMPLARDLARADITPYAWVVNRL
jgi:arsenite-transporting ATPase